ncbi:MAG: DapH/DapD/GlmU-related protein [Fusobacteriaceae bacterium]
MQKIKYIQLYGICSVIKLLIYKFKTELFYKNAKLIRFPFEIRGKKNIEWKEGFTTGKYCKIEAYPHIYNQKIIIKIGKNFQMNDSVHIGGVGEIIIGDNVLIASRVYITDTCHGDYNDEVKQSNPKEIPHTREITYKPVKIGNNVWIGEGCAILPGVTIGDGVIIGANSVVTKDIPENSIAVGNPIIIIKKYNIKEKKWIKI